MTPVSLESGHREQCSALAEEIEAEVRKLEAVFNRHDPASPVAVLNRSRPLAYADGKGVAADSRSSGVAAGSGSGRVAGSGSSGVAAGSGSGRVRAKVADDDLWFLLEIGEQFRKATFGYFDLAALSNREALPQATTMNAAEAPFRLLHSTHEIELRRGCILDFGGIAKGYALEKVRNILKAAGVENALLNFGGSSVLGMGHHPLGPCWEVAPEGPPPSAPSLNTPSFRDDTSENAAPSLNTPQFRDGNPKNNAPSLNTLQFRDDTSENAAPFLNTPSFRNRTQVFRLRDSALSVSGRDREGRDHIVDPHTGRPSRHQPSRLPGAASHMAATPAAPTHATATTPPNAATPAAPRPAAISVTGRSALICEILSTAIYAAPTELGKEIITNFEGYAATGV